MERVAGAPRPDWRAKLEAVGIGYHTDGVDGADGLNWAEDAHWVFTSDEVDALEEATETLHRLCLEAVDHVVHERPAMLTREFGMPGWLADYAALSWRRGDPSLMGRMDLALDPATGAIKLLEYNADTPTLAIETAVAQWEWLRDTQDPGADQFNSLHERLIARLGEIGGMLGGEPLHFAAFEDSAEEWAHATYFRDLAGQAGVETVGIDIPAVGWDGAFFRDLAGRRIAFLHKLYPWEWAATDAFGPHLARDACGVLEPPWKAILSNKAILPVLWSLHPGHPNLLHARMGAEMPGAGDWVVKPTLGREGANVRLRRGGTTVETGGSYGGGGWVTQAAAELPARDGWRAVIGSWVVGDGAAGVIVREAREAIVRDGARVAPHLFR